MPPRLAFALVCLVAMLGGVVAVVKQGQLPPADFTFNNDTEIESLDPAVVTGQPEGRIIDELYEGLVKLGPKDRKPMPGVAERWEVSDDGLTYTFHLRRDAKWSDGSPVTARDFVYSMRRFLDPLTLAEYAYQAWYLKNAKRYSRAARGVEIGDRVEVELLEPSADALPFARGEVLRGELVGVETDPGVAAEMLDDPAKFIDYRTFVVSIDGEEQRFRIGDRVPARAPTGAKPCRQLTLDFAEVGFRAIDDYTVETVLESPTPYWLNLLGFYPLAPVNQRCIETHGPAKWTEAENLVTNGPFRLEFRRLRDRIRLRKNPHYWNRDGVALETIDALAVQSLTTSFNLYETGKVDWITKVTPLIARELFEAEPPRDDFNPDAQFGTYFYAFNVTRKPFDDPRVRQALVLALDREEIVTTACAGELPARSFTPPGLPNYDAPECPDTNVERAKELLAEAGYPDGTGFPKIEILYNYEQQHQTIAELIRKQWRRNLGIDVSTRNEEWGSFLSSQRQQKYDVMRRAWIGDYLDPNTFLDLFVTDGENNATGWGDPEYDRLIREAKAEADPEVRIEMLAEAERILMREVPIMPIYYYVSRSMVKPYVYGWYNNLEDRHPLWALSIDRTATGPNDFMSSEPVREIKLNRREPEGAEQ
ncbi:Periplasmic oligopeptide-binding protein precursor [Botrimarina colliarenosi]|uniref:Periplasmic oligopeptide-binding protein n=1 Tax=Botrimarina colliarenosi TaxID=2528001 RepID=A0A5C6A9G6_9BACT|nr:peptide ABC transporter substrate-binding protein [Botrimarina colliarenosi]TWT96050.1 Periplasmic oligopeptide-binding protein precursor [Botrimarina colliarenosi]